MKLLICFLILSTIIFVNSQRSGEGGGPKDEEEDLTEDTSFSPQVLAALKKGAKAGGKKADSSPTPPSNAGGKAASFTGTGDDETKARAFGGASWNYCYNTIRHNHNTGCVSQFLPSDGICSTKSCRYRPKWVRWHPLGVGIGPQITSRVAQNFGPFNVVQQWFSGTICRKHKACGCFFGPCSCWFPPYQYCKDQYTWQYRWVYAKVNIPFFGTFYQWVFGKVYLPVDCYCG